MQERTQARRSLGALSPVCLGKMYLGQVIANHQVFFSFLIQFYLTASDFFSVAETKFYRIRTGMLGNNDYQLF